MNCRSVAKLVSSGDHETATWFKRLAIRFHFLMCDKCRRYAGEIKSIGEAARTGAVDRQDPQGLAELEKKLLRRIPKDKF